MAHKSTYDPWICLFIPFNNVSSFGVGNFPNTNACLQSVSIGPDHFVSLRANSVQI